MSRKNIISVKKSRLFILLPLCLVFLTCLQYENTFYDAVAQGEDPFDLVAISDTNTITLTWNRGLLPEGAEGFMIYRSRQDSLSLFPYHRLKDPEVESFSDSNLYNKDGYFYRITLLTTGGQSFPSPPIKAIPLLRPPPEFDISLPQNIDSIMRFNIFDKSKVSYAWIYNKEKKEIPVKIIRENPDWLTVNSDLDEKDGRIAMNDSFYVQIQVHPDSLPFSEIPYHTAVVLVSDGRGKTLPVIIQKKESAPMLNVSADTLSLSTSDSSKRLTIYNTGSETLPLCSISTDTNWLKVKPPSVSDVEEGDSVSITVSIEPLSPELKVGINYGRVKLFSEGGNHVVFVTMLSSAVRQPKQLLASQGVYPDRVVIEWETSDSAETYIVFRSDDSLKFEAIDTTADTRYADMEVDSVKYWYRVQSLRGDFVSSGEVIASGYALTGTPPAMDVIIPFDSDADTMEIHTGDSGRSMNTWIKNPGDTSIVVTAKSLDSSFLAVQFTDGDSIQKIKANDSASLEIKTKSQGLPYRDEPYNTDIALYSGEGVKLIPISLVKKEDAPLLFVPGDTLVFTKDKHVREIKISNAGSGEMKTCSLYTDKMWIGADKNVLYDIPAKESRSFSIRADLGHNKLAAGEHTGLLVFRSDGGHAVIYAKVIKDNTAPKWKIDTIHAEVKAEHSFSIRLDTLVEDPDTKDSLKFIKQNEESPGSISGNIYEYKPQMADTGVRFMHFVVIDGALSDTLTLKITVEITVEITRKMVRVAAGTVAGITIEEDFWIDMTEVTQADYQLIMGTNPSSHIGDNLPVEQVTWYDVILYCNQRSKIDGYDTVYTFTDILLDNGRCTLLVDLAYNPSENGYRLPTEDQWEYAARGGKETDYFWGDETDPDTVNKYAWYNVPMGETQPVATKLPNDYGLFDVSGNVHEWCYDIHATDYRVLRGGTIRSDVNVLRLDNTYVRKPSTFDILLGFRVVRPAQ